MDGLSQIYKFWPRQDNRQRHRGQNLFQVKTVQNRLNYTKMCFSCQSLNYCLKANNFSINKIMIQQ